MFIVLSSQLLMYLYLIRKKCVKLSSSQPSAQICACFLQRSTFIESHLLSKVIFHLRSSSIEGRLPLLGHFHFLVVVWHSSPQPFIICVFELVYLNDLHYFSLRAGPPLWLLLWWISRWYFRRGWCRRGPKILNICRTESYHTKNWVRISPGICWCH